MERTFISDCNFPLGTLYVIIKRVWVILVSYLLGKTLKKSNLKKTKR